MTAWFGLVYYGADWVTRQHAWRVTVHMEWERSIPFWPRMAVVYLSIFPLMWLSPLVLDATRKIRALGLSLCAVIGVAGIGFLACPAVLGFDPPPAAIGSWNDSLFRFADWINLDYNLVPSLHVALAVCCVAAYAREVELAVEWRLWAWAAAIAGSTLFTHQHHVVDVATGWVLGMAGGKLYAGINQSQV